MDWILTPAQRLDGIRATLVAAPRPCHDCDCDCPLMGTWRELTDTLLDRMLDEMALAERLEAHHG